ncbi:hypothetical protein [Neobacillus cucumis]|uniref:hypothetical protein n=1 Tax=Neobacillus cucumis TaxID=1740721 RepID=UPI0019635BD4|nr:hypothetical protein [Neobacillus cucumis]MBM7654571.1 ribosomal protein L29 [Neobacillus cucumis]
MANKRFSHADLTRSAASLKRTFYRKAKKGIYLTQKLTKEEVVTKIAKSLNVSERSLYTKERKAYLDEWYQSLLGEIEEINQELKNETNVPANKELENLSYEQLIEENKKLNERLNAYKTKVTSQQLTIEMLMKKVVRQHERIESL